MAFLWISICSLMQRIFSILISFPVESTCNAEDMGSIPGLGRSSGEGNDNPLQYSFLENLMDRGVLEGYSP